MRPLRRRAFGISAAVSAVLLVATCVLWARSYRMVDRLALWSGRPFQSELGLIRYSHEASVKCARGHLYLMVRWGQDMDAENWRPFVWEAEPYDRDLDTPDLLAAPASKQVSSWFRVEVLEFHRLGWVFGPGNGIALCVPAWLAAAVLAVLPVYWLRRQRRRNRSRAGHCPHCGYDLTGNVSGRCSECGKEIEAIPAEARRSA